MVTAIKVGSMVIGRSGKSFIVDRVDGEFIYSGKLRIAESAVAKVIPPAIFEIYDYAISNGIVFIVDRVEDDFVGGWTVSEPKSYIGGSPSLSSHKGDWWDGEFIKEVSEC
jgi:hypothetical protein